MTRREKGGTWAALRTPHDAWGVPTLVWLENGEVYWEGGLGHCPLDPKAHEIVERYPWPRKNPQCSAFFRQWLPPPVPLAQVGGWIAPNGKMWRCEGWQHNAMARVLGWALYDDPGDQALEGRGWVRVYPDGQAWQGVRYVDAAASEVPITEAQLAALLQIVDLDPTTPYAQRLRGFLESLPEMKE